MVAIGCQATAQQFAEKLYRAVDRHGQALDFMLSEHRDEAAALRFMAKAITSNRRPRSCAIDTSRENTAGLAGMNAALRRVGSDRRIRVYRSKYGSNGPITVPEVVLDRKIDAVLPHNRIEAHLPNGV